MSGLEPIVAAEVVGPAIAGEVATAAITDAVIAETVAAEIAAESARQAALNAFASSAGEALATETAGTAAAEALATEGARQTLEQQAFENFLKYGADADMSGATLRSIQAGFQNAPLNTITSLPQYLGMPAPPPGTGQMMQAARLLSPQQERQTRTSVAPPLLNKGKEVDLGSPIAGLLGGMQMPKRRRLSLI
jgi:hypothetical protein